MERTGYSEFHIIKFADLKKNKSDGNHQNDENRFERRIGAGRPNTEQDLEGNYSIGASYSLDLKFSCTYELENPLVLAGLSNENLILLQYILLPRDLERREITLLHDGLGNVFFTITGGSKEFKGNGTISTNS